MGLTPLYNNQDLCAFANVRYKDLRGQKLNHDGFYKRIKEFFILHKDKFVKVGENLARNIQKGSAVISAWHNSSDHRKNMQDPHYNSYCAVEGDTDIVLILGQTF